MRNVELPLKPAIHADITGGGLEYTLTLRSPVLARDVYVSFGDADVELSDNYFDLLPGEAMVVKVTASTDLQHLEQALKIDSLTDAFFPERPTYREHTRIGVAGVTSPGPGE